MSASSDICVTSTHGWQQNDQMLNLWVASVCPMHWMCLFLVLTDAKATQDMVGQGSGFSPIDHQDAESQRILSIPCKSGIL